MQKILRRTRALTTPQPFTTGIRAFTTEKTLDPKAYGPRKDEHDEPRFLEQVELFFNRAAKLTDVPADMLEVIKQCNSVIRFHIPL